MARRTGMIVARSPDLATKSTEGLQVMALAGSRPPGIARRSRRRVSPGPQKASRHAAGEIEPAGHKQRKGPVSGPRGVADHVGQDDRAQEGAELAGGVHGSGDQPGVGPGDVQADAPGRPQQEAVRRTRHGDQQGRGQGVFHPRAGDQGRPASDQRRAIRPRTGPAASPNARTARSVVSPPRQVGQRS